MVGSTKSRVAIFRPQTLLRKVFRCTPSDLAEREKLPSLDFRVATMNCFSNSRLA